MEVRYDFFAKHLDEATGRSQQKELQEAEHFQEAKPLGTLASRAINKPPDFLDESASLRKASLSDTSARPSHCLARALKRFRVNIEI